MRFAEYSILSYIRSCHSQNIPFLIPVAFTGGEIGTVQIAVAAATRGKYYYLKICSPSVRSRRVSLYCPSFKNAATLNRRGAGIIIDFYFNRVVNFT